MLADESLLILAAPNASEQKGGEAIKALHIFQEMKRIHANTILITHARNRHELSEELRLEDVHYIEDTRFQILLWGSVVLRAALDIWFSWRAVQLADRIAAERGLRGSSVIIHQVEPNSPVMPRSTSRTHLNVFGPINGNIYYPECFRAQEATWARMRRVLHMTSARLHGLLFRDNRRAAFILCAGGERTRRSLLACGCPERTLVESLDCGIADALLDRPRIAHSGSNLSFIHFGRLVFHKGTFLIIQSLAKTKHPVRLDVVGEGPQRAPCERLVRELGLEDRVRFLGWFKEREELFDSLHAYRATVLPSMEDANGIVVQEAMAMGLPVVCLDWGGPQLLIESGVSGFLVEPRSVDYITDRIAEHLDFLATDGAQAELMSRAARERAERWRWSTVVRDWSRLYPAG
jgi:glycosyltransferase involved in cell wall biosynthesis